MDASATEQRVDPEVKAFVFSLVSALGGSSAADDGRYVLGDDALAVLRDLKRWIRLYDEKTHRLDVRRLLAEANLVKGDLLEILAGWPDEAVEGSLRSRVALMCVDLLTQLTWPINNDEYRNAMHHFLNAPYLEKAQATYKRAILQHDHAKILRVVMRVALPAMALPQKDRPVREDNIIKVVLSLFRNMALIRAPEGLGIDEGENDISRSATINAFHHQDVFNLLLTIGSEMDNFSMQDVEILDILFHLVKGIDVERLFMEHGELVSANTVELKSLMSEERGMHAGYLKNAPSRHNRFGTMLWVKRDGGRMSTVVGQAALTSEQMLMAEMDKSKKWNKPVRRPAPAIDEKMHEMDLPAPLTAAARRHLRVFVEQFLDSSFNPLFSSARKAIEREASRVLDHHSGEYFYLISWFLQAERARRKKARETQQQGSSTVTESFGLVASVLDQETFVLVNRTMQKAQDEKDWPVLEATMKCFTQILLTVQEMSDSTLDEDQEISENVLNRIFYEQSTHDRITTLLRTYKDQSFGYLDALTRLSHVFLRLLERYSKQNVDMQVRTRRRARKSKRQANPGQSEQDATVEDRAMEVEDVAEAQRVTTERKFDFGKFAAKFVNQASVDTFIAFTRYYKDLDEEQLKRAHRFFYRVAFKMESTIFLYRMDIISLFQKLVNGPGGLQHDNPAYKEWSELARQVFRRLIKKMQERPALAVELLFSKIPSTMYYLEHGFHRELPAKKMRHVADVEVKPGMEHADEIGVAVSVLINKGKSFVLAGIKDFLLSSATERAVWQDADAAHQMLRDNTNSEAVQQSIEPPQDSLFAGESQERVVPQLDQASPTQPSKSLPPSILVRLGTPEQRESAQRDKHTRLLLTLLGCQRLNTTDDEVSNDPVWVLPSTIPATQLTSDLELIRTFEFAPPTYDNGKSAEDFLRRRAPPRRNVFGDEDNSSSDADDEDPAEASLFLPGGPTDRRSSQSPARQAGRRRPRHAPDELLDDDVLEARREARRKADSARNHKVKSAMFVHDSDDETDEERDAAFFALEEIRRRKATQIAVDAGARKRSGADEDRGASKRRRLSAALSNGSDEDEDTEVAEDIPDSEAETEADTTPPSSQLPTPGETQDDMADAESDKENAGGGMSLQKPAPRRSVRAGFIVESDSE